MKKFIPLLAVTTFFACNSDSEIKKEEAPGSDTIVVTNKNSAVTFDEKLFKQLQLPLTLDTNFVINADTNDRIPFIQIRGLKSIYLENMISGSLSFDIDEFCRIDSLKENGAYKNYLSSLDIGMLKNSIAFKTGWIDLKNGTKLFLWGLNYDSFEACPFFSGKVIIGTFVSENKQNTSFVIAERSGGGDPPSMGNEDVTAKINTDGTIDILSIRINDDLDIPGEETITEKLVLKLEKDKITVVDSKKETKSTENTTP